MDSSHITVLLRQRHPRSTPWNEALDLMQIVLKRAKCPPDVLGDVAGTLTAHKAARERTKKKAAKRQPR